MLYSSSQSIGAPIDAFSKSEHSDWFFLGRDFAIHKPCIFFVFRKAANTWPKCHIVKHLLNKCARAVLENVDPRSFL